MQGKIKSTDSAPAVYAGIDVSKDWLDVYVHPVGSHWRLSNDLVGLRRLRRQLDGLVVERLVLEATGKYHRAAHRTLSGWGFAVAVVNPLRARLFAEAFGVPDKTDRVDARLLALMGERLDPAPTAPAALELEQLQELVNARTAAKAEVVAVGNRLKAAQASWLKTEFRRQLKHLDSHIDRLTARIEHTIMADPDLSARAKILCSIPGIGIIVAAALLAGLSEMGNCSGKQASRLAGVAPVADDSGRRQGQRHIRNGRPAPRNALYMAALSAYRHEPHLAAFYERLLAKGKAKKLALTAVMRKLVVLANTLLAGNRLYAKIPPATP
jgi:transposase